jgi:hypothetical protein
MRTDDFLADLEAQLRDARPRRDLRPVAAAAIVAALCVAVLALAPRGTRERPTPAGDGVRVSLQSGARSPKPLRHAAELLRQQGYEVVETTHDPEIVSTETAIVPLEPGADAAAEKLRDLVGGKVYTDRAEQKLLARQSPGTQVFVFLATSYGLPPQEDTPVRILNASTHPGYGDAVAARLRAHGIEVASVGVAPPVWYTDVKRPRSGYATARRVLRFVDPQSPEDIPRSTGDGSVVELRLGRDSGLYDSIARAFPRRVVNCYGYGRGATVLCSVGDRRYAFRRQGKTECFVGRLDTLGREKDVLRGCAPSP